MRSLRLYDASPSGGGMGGGSCESLCGEYVVYVSKREYVHVYVCDLCRLTSIVGRVVLRPSHITALNATRF